METDSMCIISGAANIHQATAITICESEMVCIL